MEKIKVGIVGLGQRGGSLVINVLACNEAKIVALCDVYEDRREQRAAYIRENGGGDPVLYEDYRDLLADKNVDCVIVASSWNSHINVAVDSLRAGKITAMEVGGAYDPEECWDLVRTYEQTGTPIMFLENCCFDRFELLTTALVRAGKLGEVVHCHGAYAHDLRDEICGGNVNRHYRLENYRRRNCDNYPTHELGPIAKILDINRGNRFTTLISVASRASGLEAFTFKDENPDKSLIGQRFTQGDIVSTIIKCSGGQTITLSLDTTLPRYYSREFTVHGTKGMCVQDGNMVFLEESKNVHEFYDATATLSKYMNNAREYDEYLVPDWRYISDETRHLGHGGMDYFMLKRFFSCIVNGEEMPVDVYDAASWMVVTALSERSVASGGGIQYFPDFTGGKWINRKSKDVYDFGKEL